MNRSILRVARLMLVISLLGGSVQANVVPDPAGCDVLPPDTFAYPRLIGTPTGDGSGLYSELHLVIRYHPGVPAPNVYVEICFHPQCAGSLCLCGGSVLSGFTDQQGCIDFNLDLGGCCEHSSAAEIRLDGGLVLRTYPVVVSPDLTGPAGGGDCLVALGDFSTFSAGLVGQQGGCTDFTGDEETTIVDFVVFADGWGHSCSHGAR